MFHNELYRVSMKIAPLMPMSSNVSFLSVFLFFFFIQGHIRQLYADLFIREVCIDGNVSLTTIYCK